MSINQRIGELIKVLGDSESAFAKRIGVSTSVIFNIVNPKGRMSYPSGVVLEKLLALEKDGEQLSAEWLMRGRGNMFGSDTKINSPEEALDYLRETFRNLKEDNGV